MGSANLAVGFHWYATSSDKYPLFMAILRDECGLKETDPAWQLEEATFEKMGAMMAENYSKVLVLYDELSTLLTQINLYKS